MVGKEKCHIHGGKSLGGLASPRLKTARHSKYLPGNLLERYSVSLDDPNLLQLTDEIALLDARTGELLETIKAGKASVELFENIKGEYENVLDLLQSIPAFSSYIDESEENPNALPITPQWRRGRGKKGKPARVNEQEALKQMLEALNNLGNFLGSAAEQNEAWSLVQSLIEQRRRLVESERKWYIENQQLITAEKAMLLIVAISDVIKSNVTDPSQRNSIINGINQLIASSPVTSPRG